MPVEYAEGLVLPRGPVSGVRYYLEYATQLSREVLAWGPEFYVPDWPGLLLG